LRLDHFVYLVNEIFQSLQGEGPAIGSPALFIRLSGCNLNCDYCDTENQVGSRMSINDLTYEIEKSPARVVLTGGEPMLAGDELIPLAQAIIKTGRTLDIETNGTISPPAGFAKYIDNYVISPKLSNSGLWLADRKLAEALPLGPLKFVVAKVDELDEAKEIVEKMPGREIFIMPQGADPKEMVYTMKTLRPAVEALGWRLLPRLHILLGIT